MNTTEKACEKIEVRVTPTQKASYMQAANGNVSKWVKESLERAVAMCNEKQKTKK